MNGSSRKRACKYLNKQASNYIIDSAKNHRRQITPSFPRIHLFILVCKIWRPLFMDIHTYLRTYVPTYMKYRLWIVCVTPVFFVGIVFNAVNVLYMRYKRLSLSFIDIWSMQAGSWMNHHRFPPPLVNLIDLIYLVGQFVLTLGMCRSRLPTSS